MKTTIDSIASGNALEISATRPPDSVDEQSSPRTKLSDSIVRRASYVAAVFLVLTALAHLFLKEGTANLPGFVFIDVDAEANIPTWYSSMLLEILAVIAFAISNYDIPAQKTGWRGISLILFLMGMDEVASIHNMPSRRLSEMLGLEGGYMMNAWVLPAVIVCVVLGVIYLPFIWRLPSWLKRGLIVASVAYLMGAVGLEVLSSKLEYVAGGLKYDGLKFYSLRFELCAVAEEIYEYVGILAAMAALLKHASNLGARLTLDFAGGAMTARPAM
ncbi:hypothetical protein [Prosthecobacter sp.]|uniref:hypothetical protein n=1 Tax=Prosthecobacter sp. TaxID=1965333 RepID=UPI001D40FD4B|nr:hypothetical protein [Prosthecobacter sp.]MCB1277908.1 hypothetical protein [Prosthecobacter sp.]